MEMSWKRRLKEYLAKRELKRNAKLFSIYENLKLLPIGTVLQSQSNFAQHVRMYVKQKLWVFPYIFSGVLYFGFLEVPFNILVIKYICSLV